MASNPNSETTPLIGNHTSNHNSSTSRTKWNKRRIYASILLTETLERMTYYGLTANLVIYLSLTNSLNVSSYYSILIQNSFNGVKFFMCFFGGWFADAYVGRYKAIILGLITYAVGIALFPIASIPNYFPQYQHKHFPIKPLIISGLFLVAIGCGLVKSNLPPFGAEQVKRNRSGRSKEAVTQSFFNWFYWSINLGSLLAYLIVAYMQQKQERFFVSYLILVTCMLLAIVAFLSSHNIYHLHHRPSNRVGQTLRLLARRCCCFSLRSSRHDVDHHRPTPTDYDNAHNSSHLIPPSTPERLISNPEHSGNPTNSAINEAEIKNIKKIAIIFISLLPFWAAYSQMQSTYLLQALHLKLYPQNTHPSFVIPVAWLSLFDIFVILAFLPVLDRFIYPYFERLDRPITVSIRFVIGLVFAFISVLWAAELEVIRSSYGVLNQQIGDILVQASDVWVYWQIPQYIFIGFSEMFASVTAMKFAYSRAPPHLQGTVMGFFDLMTGVGYFLGLGVLAILRSVDLLKLISRVRNTPGMGVFENSRLDTYFLILAAMIFLTIVIFIIFDIKYNIDVLNVTSSAKVTSNKDVTQSGLYINDRVNSHVNDSGIVT
ncbi:uncharacterized protein TRIADDRAFT_57267 [Trichoplax adhaerens]|uniref:Major facilitator superfamily (MFS) profile domain-containing protein n=1 Tax=Trichoplax adhaerens TaxID=10228 RepID=B3RYZ1_TRIAD|nr:hypothetical protein TRIADDRAFT_57267 [Trichoplax adhaerens]EDV23753.1 hypothetical protein TRIADDRAFT_57267 [Trichoplax adhaerens]|eukprot:XP_002113279.1 hypothetical protein TRIADDRAFT_57267 [Trichoplax adhaerens]